MTAEIVVANKSAVALAADSKVTIGSSRNAKTYDSVNKVFTLSKSCPVGIMIFGNAEFMKYPWETIIKLYRRERGGQKKNYILDWSNDFQTYVSAFGKIQNHHRQENIKSIIYGWLYSLESDAQAAASASSVPYPSPDYDGILLKTIEGCAAWLKQTKPWLPKAKAKKLLKAYDGDITAAIKDVFAVEQDSDLFKASAVVAAYVLTQQVDSPQSSGFVIAGFGEKEFFPTVIEHNTDGFIGTEFKIRREDSQDISRSMPGFVGAFAQRDMANIFMNGFDEQLIRRLTGSLGEVLQDSCIAVLDTYGTKAHKSSRKVREDVANAAKGRVGALVQDFVNDSRNRFSGPILEMVSLLPKEELAHLAESLVALTSLRRRVSREVETVGGAVDVALISKGDGFVWIKRKHYFKQEINPQFIRNYMSDVREEG